MVEAIDANTRTNKENLIAAVPPGMMVYFPGCVDIMAVETSANIRMIKETWYAMRQ